jgi:SAM-dependent methyltransferase
MTDIGDQRYELLDGWERAAKGWGRQAERWSEANAPVTERMLALGELTQGARVVELAAGPGELAFHAAPLVAPTKVLCTDAVKAMVEVARERAEDLGVENVEFQQLQLEWIDLPAASVDVVFCRYGVMLCVDPEAALRECRRVLAPGGSLVLAVWDTAKANPWMALPTLAAIELGLMAPTAKGAPGPSTLSEPGLLQRMLSDVGFFDIAVDTVPLGFRYRDEVDWLGEKIDHSPSFGAIWRDLRDTDRAALRAAVADGGRQYASVDQALEVPGAALVAVGHA